MIENYNDIAITDTRRKILNIIDKTLIAMDPENAIKNFIEKNNIKFDSKRIFLIGFGKAAFKMYSGIRPFILKDLVYASIIVPDDEKTNDYNELRILRGTHPFTGDLSVSSSISMLSGLKNLNENDLVIVLISGGGSSLFEIPEDGINIDDIKNISKTMMDKGCDIYELNMVRSMLSKVKGGKLATMLYPARVISFIISDVKNDDLSIIASGPLTRIDYRIEDLMETIKKYLGNDERIKMYRNIDDIYFNNVKQYIILKNRDFLDYIYSNINDDAVNLGSNFSGNVEDLSLILHNILKNIYSSKRKPFYFMLGGETTVDVKGHGSGGRNQELVLRFMKNSSNSEVYTIASFGTDGIDGVSPAAGGIVDSDHKIDNINEYLNRNDSYNLLIKNHGAIITGRTGNNVSDIIIGLYYNK
ncbi:glycerate 2-kinase [Picrophilus oshimae]|uniref:Glycerate 2-kinase n=1 Tax=Picrophilus torridus (strain ATCC 700027 / DSM 9790 / JCM 10055 / NBRC 100828 / KAW 2/3) TaxID=1122961 RepID=A0A8G2FWQ1_PICTO|nr:glycerate 2-kinase [Picrophilus oshimae]SMD30902.1 glycerate 2-kinase [Picrophilus oshimae DSM 9789]